MWSTGMVCTIMVGNITNKAFLKLQLFPGPGIDQLLYYTHQGRIHANSNTEA